MLKVNCNEQLLKIDCFFIKLCSENILLIGQFLDPQTILMCLQSLQPYIKKTLNYSNRRNGLNLLYRSLYVRQFINKHINATDRSNYYDIYNNKQFKQNENKKLSKLYQNAYDRCHYFTQIFEQLKNGIKNELNQINVNGEELFQNVFLNITDPMLPETLFKKSNIGMYCNSSFQNMLVEKHFKLKKQKFVEEIYVQLSQNLNDQKQAQLNQTTIVQKLKINSLYSSKFDKIYNEWFWIDSENYLEYLIVDNLKKQSKKCIIKTVNNLFVYLMVLFDNFMEILDFYIQCFSDDYYHQFLETNLRYSLLKNTILELQNQFQFLFDLLNQINSKFISQNEEENSSTQNQKYKQQPIRLSFWRCILSKWYSHMSHRDYNLNFTYSQLLKKQNYSEFKKNLNNLDEQIKVFKIPIENSLIFDQEQIVESIAISSFYTESYLQSFFLQDQYLVKQTLHQYVQYLVDLSVCQDSIHWCGHSQHVMNISYFQYEQKIIDQMKIYFERIYNKCHIIDQKNSLFINMINKIFYELDKEYLKPVTLKKLVKFVNDKWKINTKQLNSPKSPKSPLKKNILNQLNISSSQRQQIIKIDFTQRDMRIQCFNKQNNINKNNYLNNGIIIYKQQQNLSLKKSSDTNCTRSSQKRKSLQNYGLLNKIQKTSSQNYIE